MVDVNINLNKVFSVVLHEEKKEEEEKKDGTEPSEELEQETRNYRYPLTLNESFPAYIKFSAVDVDGVDFLESIKDAGVRVATGLASVGASYTLPDSVENNESEASNELTEEEEKTIVNDSQKKPTEESFYDAGQGEVVGSVTLPLQRSLQFQDNVQYNVANLGISGSMAAVAAEGNNPFAGMMGGDGRVTGAVGALTTAAVAKNALAAVGGGIGNKLGGTSGTILGVSALSNAGEGVGNLVKAAGRVASNPNQRTLFEQVGMRDFSFTFKMVANNEKESREIKNIVKFFREELYPEPITTSSGVQLAYEFPNMFDIEIKNFVGDAPSPKIQRCYLLGVQTNYNATASTMHPDGNFVEVDITLNFKEITALNKKKVRDGGF